MTGPTRDAGAPLIRIGELARRVGLSEDVLRAWEHRYGVLAPTRSAGGFRLYSPEDEQRVRQMQGHVAGGLSPAEAARTVLRRAAPPRVEPPPATTLPERRAALAATLEAYDEPGAQVVLDHLLTELSLSTALRDVVLPYLADLGDRWASGAVTVAQEHFASSVLRGRLAALARGWGSGRGPLAVLACPPSEQHDLALMAFGLILRLGGWRIHYLGPATPLADLIAVADDTASDLVVLAATMPDDLEACASELTELAARARLALAGSGATSALAHAVGAELLPGDPVTEAERLWSDLGSAPA
ncbi:MAG TPA: MerR family transcriptional regulator [Mycobacteriales bacterium]|nr:MerR family transcriptional regulator [Mycobacteriales bacterium]